MGSSVMQMTSCGVLGGDGSASGQGDFKDKYIHTNSGCVRVTLSHKLTLGISPHSGIPMSTAYE